MVGERKKIQPERKLQYDDEWKVQKRLQSIYLSGSFRQLRKQKVSERRAKDLINH